MCQSQNSNRLRDFHHGTKEVKKNSVEKKHNKQTNKQKHIHTNHMHAIKINSRIKL